MKAQKKWCILGVITIVLGLLSTIILMILIGRFNLFNINEELGFEILLANMYFFTFLSVFFFIKYIKERERIYMLKEKERLIMLEKKYSMYVSLVNEIQSEIKNNKEMERYSKICFSKENDYLLIFEKYLNNMSKNLIKGKLDTFIVATFLTYSLIVKPRLISLEYDDETAGYLKNDQKKEKKFINMRILHFNCVIPLYVALKLISEPITYYQNEKGEWIEQKHPKVDIIVPEGIIEKSPLYINIYERITDPYRKDEEFSIIQFSNLLHLIYLNSKK